MKRFTLSFLGVFIIGFMSLWGWMITNTIQLSNGGELVWLPKFEMVRRCDIGELLIMGDSSPSLGFIPSRMGADAVNLAVGATTPIESYLFSRKILSCPTLPKAVVLSFTAWHFMADVRFQIYLTQYNISSFDELDELRRYTRKINADYLGLGQKKHADVEIMLQELGYAHHFPAYFSTYLLGDLIDYFRGRQAYLDYFDRAFKKRGEFLDYQESHGSKGLASLVQYRNFDPQPFFDRYFQALIAGFEEKNIPVYYVIMPVNEQTMEAMTPESVSGYIAYLRGYERRYANFHLLTPAYPVLPWTDFRDGDHLNYDGARAWSDQVREMLNEANVPGGPFAAQDSHADEASGK